MIDTLPGGSFGEPPPMKTSPSPASLWDRCPACASTDVTYDHSAHNRINATCEKCYHIGSYAQVRTPLVVLS